ncbi:MAG: 4Fe-4S dicluster domain-containing protein [Spirosoma sp.]|nr:4Fe-4S dicluster domain-containing protein [Spirosoma sp.]
MTYFHDIRAGIRTTLKGLSLTWRHLRQATHRRTPEGIASDNYFDQQNGLVTLQYPHEQLPVPDNGRYRLRNEIDDCIVCDKCAKICPVDCITIDAIKATEEVGRASDGSPIRLYAATFDIDMAKCCYCGLCTVVCPTECLTMDKKFDYSEYELGKLTYNFANLTPAEADEKRGLYEQFVREKEAAKLAQAAAKALAATAQARPPEEAGFAETPAAAPAAKRPVFRPTARPAAKPAESVVPELPATTPDPTANPTDGATAHPLTDATSDKVQQGAPGEPEVKKRPVFMPTRKPANPVVPAASALEPDPIPTVSVPETPALPKPRPAFRPTMKPKPAPSTNNADETSSDTSA